MTGACPSAFTTGLKAAALADISVAGATSSPAFALKHTLKDADGCTPNPAVTSECLLSWSFAWSILPLPGILSFLSITGPHKAEAASPRDADYKPG